MKYKIFKLIIFFLFGINISINAQKISGTIYGTSNDKHIPLPGANVYWANTVTGVISNSKAV